ncbi:hypothetical protein AB0M43_37725 [Longispora sp. NPDC051575]|uniref:hypothetical protein n=1 Tax=Longispora sp. NPDC051575 TaxID=3154943 RepID=UPI003417830E
MTGSLMSSTRTPTPRRGLGRMDLIVRAVVLGALIVLVPSLIWTLWLAGQVGGLLTHLAWPAGEPADAPLIAARFLAHPGDPGRAWPEAARGDVAPAWLLYPLWVVQMALILFAIVGTAARATARWGRRRGFATRKQLAERLSAEAMVALIPTLRPALAPAENPEPEQETDP